MAKITNHARGPRGISLKDGSTIWLDPGQSEDIKKDDIAGPLPDLGVAPAVASSEDSNDRVAALSAEIDSLKADHAQALAAEKQRADDAEKLLAEASAEIDSLKADHAQALAAEKQRADDAEKLLAEASAEIDSLKAQVAKFDADGDGKTGGSKAEAKK